MPKGPVRRPRWCRSCVGVTIVESLRPLHWTSRSATTIYTVLDPSVLGGLVKQAGHPRLLGALHGGRRRRLPPLQAAGATSSRRRLPRRLLGQRRSISLLHYTDISLDDLSAFQNTFVFADVALGAAVLAFGRVDRDDPRR